MKVFISVDMEGITGIAGWDEMTRDRNDANELITGDVNAVIEGILAGTPDVREIIVADSHSTGQNILYHRLHPRASLIRGFPRPYYMMSGLMPDHDRVYLVGYHAAAGAPRGLMDHTYSGSVVHEIRVNDKPLGELEINAAYATHFGIPVVFTSGDLDFVRYAETLETGMETVATKEWIARTAAKLYPLERVRDQLYEKARLAAARPRNEFKPWTFTTPAKVQLLLARSEQADMVALLPSAKRLSARKIAFEADSAVRFMEMLLCVLKMAYK